MNSFLEKINSVKQFFRQAAIGITQFGEPDYHTLSSSIRDHDIGMTRYLSARLNQNQVNEGLYYASIHDDIEIAKFFINEKGANECLLPLWGSISNGSTQTKDYLAKITPLNSLFYSVYSRAQESEISADDLRSSLESKSAVPHILGWAAAGNNVRFLESNKNLIQDSSDTDVNTPSNGAGHLFRIAAQFNAVDCLRFLHENFKIDVNDHKTYTSCMADAAYKGHFEAVKFIREECNGDPDIGQVTALEMSKYSTGNPRVTSYLTLRP